jgi:Domain of unknown function (DUF4186)
MSAWKPSEEKPLKGVKRCKKTDCAKQLHCFLKDRHRKTPEGTCLECGAAPVDWHRVHRHDLKDVEYTIAALKREHIRHEFWCNIPWTPKATTFARKHGRSGILRTARVRIETKLRQPGKFADWGQIPFEDRGDAIHFAQHATATCCRRCMEVWHAIARDRALSAHEVEYFAQLILCYVVDHLPDLADGPIKAPRKARTTSTLRKAS